MFTFTNHKIYLKNRKQNYHKQKIFYHENISSIWLLLKEKNERKTHKHISKFDDEIYNFTIIIISAGKY